MSCQPLSFRQRLNGYMGGQSSATLGYPPEAEVQMPYAYPPVGRHGSRQGPKPVPPHAQYAAMGDGHQQAGQQMYYPPRRDQYSVGPSQASSALGRRHSHSDIGLAPSQISAPPQESQWRGVPNSFAMKAKDCFKALEVNDIVPLTTTLSAAIYHHYKNRNASELVPYRHPHWMNYVYKAMMVYSAFRFAKNRGLIGSS
ncbi:hypothetical protein IWQ57_002666, partial [Coemansia nantahalensis]